MGVPVVSLAGETFISRAAESILHQADLGDLVVDSPAAYVACARELAGDVTRLRTLRSSLRDRIASSPMCKPAAYARSIEAAYQKIWGKWCAKSNAAP